MALTGMAIYKSLPKTNCGDCGFPTCMAFSMQVAAKQKALTDCPHVSDDAKNELSDASAPPMKLVKIGADEGAVEIGQETVMFRHEEKFHKSPAVAAMISASLSDDDAMAKLDAIHKAQFTRIGQQIGVRLAAVEIEGMDADAAKARVSALADKSSLPLVLMGSDAAAMGAAVSAIAAKRPLIYRAEAGNVDAMAQVAADNKCPMAVTADTLEEIADVAKVAKDKGVEEIIMSFDGKDTANSIRKITKARRAALKKGFRATGFPSMVDIRVEDPMKETVLATTFVTKYASILIINGLDGSELLPILTTIQNIYTDPQVPNTVEAKLYEVGDVTENSPVLFTTNFSLTYFCVEGEVERSKVPCYISVIDTEGLGVLNAFAGDKLSAAKVVKALKEQGVTEKVSHNKLIIPGLLPAFRSEIEDSPDWDEVLIGPEAASGIPAYLQENWK